MALEVVDIYKVGNALNIEVLNLENRELVKITPSQLVWGILYNKAPVINATASLNDACINIGGQTRVVRVSLSQKMKQMIRDKEREERKEQQRSRTRDDAKQDEINRTVYEYRKREEERKERMKQMSANFARPGELTDEERRRRRQEYFRQRSMKNQQKEG